MLLPSQNSPSGQTPGWQAGAIETAVDSVTALLVLRGGDQAAGLVEHQVDAARRVQRLAIDAHMVATVDDGKFGVVKIWSETTADPVKEDADQSDAQLNLFA